MKGNMTDQPINQSTITPLRPDDWPQVWAIYLEGIATGNATFETSAPDWATWDQARRPDCRLAARSADGTLLGWAALSPVSSRAVYAGVAEVSVYVAASARGQGVGRALLSALVEASEAAGVWTLTAGIFPENVVSIHLHHQCGFRILGTAERRGQRHGVWRDVTLMERRSPKI